MPLADRIHAVQDARQRALGLSLVELLIGLTVGAVLVAALASATRIVGEQVSYVRADTESQLERAMTILTDGIRRAWTLEQPAAAQLRLTDVYGNATDVFLANGALSVTRPSGATGVLVDNVASLVLDVQTVQRRREATPLDQYGTWWSASEPAGAPISLEFYDDSGSSYDDGNDGGDADDNDDGDDDDDGDDGDDDEGSDGDGSAIALGFMASATAPDSAESVPGITEELLTTTMDRLLLPLAWLDTSSPTFCHLHASPPHDPNHPSNTGVLTVELYEAQAPGVAEPYGPMLASVSMSTQLLPTISFWWWDTENLVVVNPPGGAAWGWWSNHPEVVLQTGTPAADVPLDMTGLAAAIQPGLAYTLVLRVSGLSRLYVRAVPIGSATLSGVALQADSGGSWTTQALGIGRTQEGLQTFTQTGVSNVPSRVTLSVNLTDGRALTGSAGVLGQLAAPNPWLSTVPGETPALEQDGM